MKKYTFQLESKNSRFETNDIVVFIHAAREYFGIGENDIEDACNKIIEGMVKGSLSMKFCVDGSSFGDDQLIGVRLILEGEKPL